MGFCGKATARHVLAVLAFFGCVNLFALRVNLSIALVAMVNHTTNLNQSHSDECASTTNHNVSRERHQQAGTVFDWDEQLQGHILGAFFYGYCLTQVLGGWLAQMVGGKRVFGSAVFITSVLSLFTPMTAGLSVYCLIAIRVLQGMAQGFAFPSIHCIWSTWAPAKERSRLVAFTYAGAQLGVVIAMPVTGILCQQTFGGGWPSAFYMFGAFGMIWSVAWVALVSDSPDRHPRITSQERDYIQASAGRREKSPVKPPWRKIMSSPAIWAIVAAHFAYDWGSFTGLTMIPQFMQHVLKFDVTENGGLSALPYLALWLANAVCGPLADRLRKRFSTKVTRKILNTVGLLVPAVLILGVGFVGCDPILAVTLLTLGVGMSGFTLAGFSVNHIDIAPRFAGILMGISNTFGTTAGFIGPVVVGALTNNQPSISQWRIFFIITAVIYAVGGVVFLCFSEGDELDWAKRPGHKSRSLCPSMTLFVEPLDDNKLKLEARAVKDTYCNQHVETDDLISDKHREVRDTDVLISDKHREVRDTDVLISDKHREEVRDTDVLISDKHREEVRDTDVLVSDKHREVRDSDVLISDKHREQARDTDVLISDKHREEVRDSDVLVSDKHREQARDTDVLVSDKHREEVRDTDDLISDKH